MKIAFVGKGGSGKSALTWLFAHTLAEQGKQVYIIDADHNMDSAATFGITVTSDTPTFHRSHEIIRQILGITPTDRWQTLLAAPHYPSAIHLTDSHLKPLWQKPYTHTYNWPLLAWVQTILLAALKCCPILNIRIYQRNVLHYSYAKAF